MEPILQDLEDAVESLQAAQERADANLGTRLMVSEQLNNTRRLRDRVSRIVEAER